MSTALAHSPAALRLYRHTGALRLHGGPSFGVLVRAAGADLAADVVADPAARAALLGRDRAVLCLRGAAWVHAGRHAPGSPPQPEHAPLPGRRRDALPRQLRLRPDDVVHLGPVPVTTPVRTALDLARLVGEDDALRWLVALARAGLDLEALAGACAAPRGPGARVHDRRRRGARAAR